MKILHRAQHRARIPVPSPYCNVVQESVRQLSWVSRLLLCWGWLESWVTEWTGRDLSQINNKKNSAKTPHVRIFNFVLMAVKLYPWSFEERTNMICIFLVSKFYILFVWWAVKFLQASFLDVFWYVAFVKVSLDFDRITTFYFSDY